MGVKTRAADIGKPGEVLGPAGFLEEVETVGLESLGKAAPHAGDWRAWPSTMMSTSSPTAMRIASTARAAARMGRLPSETLVGGIAIDLEGTVAILDRR